MVEYEVTDELDVTGQNCPMPVVKTSQRIDGLDEGDVLEVLATDPGSMTDLAGWAETTEGVELVGQEEGDGVFTHYVRKAAPS
jgi:TusA-related sulfurtransferase